MRHHAQGARQKLLFVQNRTIKKKILTDDRGLLLEIRLKLGQRC